LSRRIYGLGGQMQLKCGGANMCAPLTPGELARV